MILVCPKYDKVALEQADIELTKLSKKIVVKNKKIKVKNAIRDVFKSFSHFLSLMFDDKDDSKVYIAVIASGGIGDLIRQAEAISMLGDLFPSVAIDIYNRGSKRFLPSIKNVRFFLDKDAALISRKKYDIVVDFSYKVTSGIADTKINNLENNLVKKFAAGFEEIKREYSYCFDNVDNQYIFQKKAVENGLRISDVMKLTSGIKDIKKNTKLVLNYKDQDIKKFGLNKGDKYITFQHGWGDKGYIPSKIGMSLKLWETENWKSLLGVIKRELKNYKIVQVGINSVKFEETDIDLNGKTSFDELCAVLKYSSLHIDTDCGCVHIAKVLNTQSVVLFGLTDIEYICYDNNINIMSGLCRNCYTMIEDANAPCIRGFAKPLCMGSITPDFVAKVILERLGKINENP
jgi:ADP-heptose:LPS heptosyltransferase